MRISWEEGEIYVYMERSKGRRMAVVRSGWLSAVLLDEAIVAHRSPHLRG
jgi:hypothetical protein